MYGPSLLCGVKSDFLWVKGIIVGVVHGQKCYMCIVEHAQECKLVSGLHAKVLVSVNKLSLGQVGVRNQKPCMHPVALL